MTDPIEDTAPEEPTTPDLPAGVKDGDAGLGEPDQPAEGEPG